MEKTIERYNGRPSVNVKVHNDATRDQLAEIEREQGPSALGFAEWYAKENRDPDGSWTGIAQEDALQLAQDDADMIFGKGTTVSLEGRSGGHLAVAGLPSIEDGPEAWGPPENGWPDESEGWNIDGVAKLGPRDTLAHRWRYFAACAKSAAQDFPRRVADLICANVYIPMMEAQAAKEADKAERAKIAEELRDYARSGYWGTPEGWRGILQRAAELLEREGGAA